MKRAYEKEVYFELINSKLKEIKLKMNNFVTLARNNEESYKKIINDFEVKIEEAENNEKPFIQNQLKLVRLKVSRKFKKELKKKRIKMNFILKNINLDNFEDSVKKHYRNMIFKMRKYMRDLRKKLKDVETENYKLYRTSKLAYDKLKISYSQALKKLI